MSKEKHFDCTHEYVFDGVMDTRGYSRNDNLKFPKTLVYQDSEGHTIRINNGSGYIYSHYKGFSMSVCPAHSAYESYMRPGKRRSPLWNKRTPLVSTSFGQISVMSVLTEEEIARLKRRDYRRKIREQMKVMLKKGNYDAIKKLRRETGIGLTWSNCFVCVLEWTSSGVLKRQVALHREVIDQKLYQQGQRQDFLKYIYPMTERDAEVVTERNLNFNTIGTPLHEVIKVLVKRFPNLISIFDSWAKNGGFRDNTLDLRKELKLMRRKVKLESLHT